ncbi:hypothetical protein GIB67_039808 [Kingdonia uniflora]|uniref:Transposase n=1 Tax=Kingdonia uniflora TaxID=39325 RepID=A0A7J7P326_9MAGN|nr:hypothetical protein GIB67_039808 [Kingdonia uniflora]
MPNSRWESYKQGKSLFMDDDADDEQPMDKKGKNITLENLKFEQVRKWVLSCFDGVEDWEKHKNYLNEQLRASRGRGARSNVKPMAFIPWLRQQLEKDKMSTLKRLADGPSFKAVSYKGYRVNGYVFNTKDSESCKTTQNSGIKMKAMTNFRSSSRNQNLVQEETTHYGVVREIIELDYYDFKQTVFYCDWVQIEEKINGFKIDPETNLTFVNLVFYCKDPSKDDWYAAIDAPQRLTKDIDAYEDPLVFEARTSGMSISSGRRSMPSDQIEDSSNLVPQRASTSPGLLRKRKALTLNENEYELSLAAKDQVLIGANIAWKNKKCELRKVYDKYPTEDAIKNVLIAIYLLFELVYVLSFDWIGTCLDELEEDCQDVRDATNRCNEILYCISEHSSKGYTSERNLQADPEISENGWKRCFSENGWKGHLSRSPYKRGPEISEKDEACTAVTAQPGTASTVPGVQRNKGPCGVHGRAVGVYQPSSRAQRASGIQPTDARATSG